TNVSTAEAERFRPKIPGCRIFTEAPGATDLERLQGNWLEVGCEFNGESVVLGQQRPPVTRRITGTQSFVKDEDGNTLDGLSFRLFPGRTPKAIDVDVVRGPDAGQRNVGIYHWDGDKLVICWTPAGQARPTEFATKRGTDICLQTWKRAP